MSILWMIVLKVGVKLAIALFEKLGTTAPDSLHAAHAGLLDRIRQRRQQRRGGGTPPPPYAPATPDPNAPPTGPIGGIGGHYHV